MKYPRRGSHYYIDVGASQRIIDGKIKLKRGQVKEMTETGVKLDAGSELAADVIVYATGNSSMNGWAADLISQDVTDKVGKVWGLGSDTPKDPSPWEGEQRNMWNRLSRRPYGSMAATCTSAPLFAVPRPSAQSAVEGIPTPVTSCRSGII